MKTKKTREFWVVEREDNTGPFFAANKELARSKVEDGDDDLYLVREVVSIDWEKVWKEFNNKHEFMPANEAKTIKQLVDKQLAGEE